MAKLALFLIPAPLLVVLLVAGVKSSRLTIFEEAGYRGTPIFDQEVGPDCLDLVALNDRAASARATGNCVHLYEHYGCTGQQATVSTQCPVESFGTARVHMLLSSVRACSPTYPSFLQRPKLRLFENYDFQGLMLEMVPSEECTNIEPPNLNDRTSSVDIGGTCVILYRDYDCSGPQITLFPGSNFHNNLAKLNFDKTLSSVRACCEQTNWSHMDPTSPRVL